MEGPGELEKFCLLWIPKFVLSGSSMQPTMSAFFLFLDRFIREWVAWRSLKEKASNWGGRVCVGVGGGTLLVLRFIHHGKGTLRSRGLLDLLLSLSYVAQ